MTAVRAIETHEPWIQIYSGKPFPFLSPGVSDIDILDIAHALSMQCRFNGHVKKFYSVAEHSINVSYEVPEKHALAGLLHDAAEAYIGDMVSPLKDHMPEFREIEHRIEAAIYRRFNVPLYSYEKEREVGRADRALLIHEGRTLLNNPSLVDEWSFANNPDYERKNVTALECFSPQEAKAQFLARFDELTYALSKD